MSDDTGTVFTPKREDSKARNTCSVPGCRVTKKDNRNRIFHRYPTAGSSKIRVAVDDDYLQLDRLDVWLHNIMLDDERNLKSKWVCSRHFKPSDYHIKPRHGKKKRHVLKYTAVPTVNVLSENILCSMVSNIADSIAKEGPEVLKRQSNCTVGSTPAKKTRSGEMCSPNIDSMSSPLCTTLESSDVNIFVSPSPTKRLVVYADVGIQCKLDDFSSEETNVCTTTNLSDHPVVPSMSLPLSTPMLNEVPQVPANEVETPPLFTVHTDPEQDIIDSGIPSESNYSIRDFINTDKKLLQMTGIKSFQYLDFFCDSYKKINPTTRKGMLKPEGKVLLFFMKLRLSLPFTVLAILFNISQPTCKKIFEEALEIFEGLFEEAIPWPDKSEILSNLPRCFKKFPRVRIVLDATEIKTTKTKCLVCRCKGYSHYKGCHTVKFLLGVTPAGLFSFVSKAFGGRATDKFIFEASKLIEKLEPYVDDVMVDKGVLIKNICAENHIGLIHPPFLGKKLAQLPEKDAQKNVQIAGARVHVERAIERVKKFRIFKECLPWGMVKYADSIMKVLCAIVNMSNPILSRDKFLTNDEIAEVM